VALRLDALDHLQLPFALRSGRIGRIQAQVPWRALRSPVVVDLADVHLCVALRRDEELEEGPAGERAWLAKLAELAAAELAALAAAGASGSEAAGRQGGVLWSFMQHVVNMLVNRLQLTVSNVHIEFEVGASARLPAAKSGCQRRYSAGALAFGVSDRLLPRAYTHCNCCWLLHALLWLPCRTPRQACASGCSWSA
jgi:hypothetical protein